jgi:tetratricopeptide (TPR) repeat protein
VRGFLYYSLGDLEKALSDFDKCMAESVKQNPLNFYLNGMILGELGKNEEAIDEFKKALNASE